MRRLAVTACFAAAGCGDRTVETSIDVKAPPSRVWAVLADTASYPDWNPATRLAGELKPGAVIVNTQLNGDDHAVFHPTVLAAAPDRELRWRGRLWGVPGLFEGEHYFLLHPTAEGTNVIQGERFSGALLIFWNEREEVPRFEAVNAALKARAEKATAP